MATIYKIINNISGKIYVGATSRNIGYRMALHKHSAFTLKSDSEICKAIREAGWSNISFSEIESCSKRQMFKRERHWIVILNTMWPNGYNTESSHLEGAYQSDIVKEKKSIAQTERFKDPKQRKKHSVSLKKMFKDPELKEKHRLGLVNSWTDERREEYSEKAKNNENLIAAKGYLKAKEVLSKEVVLYNNETKQETTYKSLTDCARSNNWSIAAVSKQIKKQNFLFEKYIVKFKRNKTKIVDLLEVALNKDLERREKMILAKKGKSPWNKGRRVSISQAILLSMA